MLAIDVLIKVRTRVYIGRNVCWPRQGTASKDNIILLGQQHTDRQVGQTDRQRDTKPILSDFRLRRDQR